MFVFQVPEKYVNEYHFFLTGEYSKFSSEYQKLFKPNSLPYKVIDKDPGLRRTWEKRLDEKLDVSSELYGVWKPQNEIYNHNKINIKNESKNNQN